MNEVPDHQGVNVVIGGREYFVSCSDSERGNLLKAAQYLNTDLEEIQQSNRSLNFEKCVVMVALNLAADLIQQSTIQESQTQKDATIAKLVQKIDTVLNE